MLRLLAVGRGIAGVLRGVAGHCVGGKGRTSSGEVKVVNAGHAWYKRGEY